MIEALESEFEIIDIIGRGGMGVVYKARQISLDRTVAIKMLIEDLAKDEEFIDRFRREARVVAALNHPNILAIHDIRQAQGNWFIISEYVAGGTVRHLLSNVGTLPVNEACRVVSQACSALYYTHSRGVIHRDIKPDNVMFTESLQVKLADFGLARFSNVSNQTRPGVCMGTPSYMSPEQAADRDLDHRSDIYSLGILFFEMLTGCLPFIADNPFAVVIKHMNAMPPRPSELNPELPAWIDEVILTCLEKDPNDRFADCRELAQALDEKAQTSTYADWLAPGIGDLPYPVSVPLKKTPVRTSRTEPKRKDNSDPIDEVLNEVKDLLISSERRQSPHSTHPRLRFSPQYRGEDALGQYQSRMSALLSLCKDWDCAVPEEVLLHIAAHSEGRNRDELADLLQRLISTSLATGKPISTALATELLR